MKQRSMKKKKEKMLFVEKQSMMGMLSAQW
jgi:hypothetical protein